MKRIIVKRVDDTVEVLLLPHKDGSGWTFVNLTKGHICPCIFPDEESALHDLEKYPKVVSYKIQDT